MGAFPSSGSVLQPFLPEDEPQHSSLARGFRDAAKVFSHENKENSRAYVQVICASGLLVGLLTWVIQRSAVRLGALRTMLGGNESIWLAMAFNVCLVVLARLIVRRSEAAQGSGYPQMKAMFFGNTSLMTETLGKPNLEFLSAKTLVQKASALMLMVASGLPIGQEGPNVHMAACISRHIRPQFFEKNLKRELVVQILHAACASGVAATFSSLLGGVLLSLELMLPQIYTFQVYWGCFFGAVFGSVTTMLLKEWSMGGIPRLLDSDVQQDEGVPTHYPMLCCLGYLVIGIIFGVLGGLFNLAHDKLTRFCTRYWRVQTEQRHWRDLIFVAFAAILDVALLWNLPLLKGRRQPDLLNTLFSKEFFAREDWAAEDLGVELTLWAALAAKLVTTLLALALPVPTGVVAPSMVLGALLMRAICTQLPDGFFTPLLRQEDDLGAFLARLSILGASAFSCAVVRAYGVAITTFEAMALSNMGVPLSLSSLTAIFVADLISLPFFDTALVRKGWQGVSQMTCTNHAEEPAFLVMQPHSEFISLPEMASLEHVDAALRATPLEFSFPVISTDDHLSALHPHHHLLRGTISREALAEVKRRLEASQEKEPQEEDKHVSLLSLRWEDSQRFGQLLADILPLSVDPLATVQELYMTLKVVRKEVAYVTAHGVLLGRVGFKELIGEGMPIAKGLGAFHDQETFKAIYNAESPQSWAGM
ncbi:unnamed protein product [Effrenium voratum]|nr:unnamed protein product [Effrenium voratum]